MAHDAPAMSGDPNSNSPSGSSHTTANAIPNPPFMRHRISGRAAAFDEGLGTLSPSQMRSNSMFSISSFDETRRSLRTSTDDLLLPRVSRPEDDLHEEPSQWQSLPLALAIIPAFGGLLFSNGRATVTDILLLGLSAIFLNWSLRLPWEWYYATRAVRLSDPLLGNQLREETIMEEESQDELNGSKGPDKLKGESPYNPTEDEAAAAKTSPAATREAASNELRSYQLLALLSCFICPILGAYLLHLVRTSLSRRSEELLSDFNITIFLMAAEMRPIGHVLKMIQSRTLYLQRIVQPGQLSTSSGTQQKIQDLAKRVEELEAHLDSVPVREEGKSLDTSKIVKDVRSSLQTELDALNRAVRRYEKRFTTHSFQTQARFEYIEKRLNDTLSLAAAAAQSQQKPGIVAIALNSASAVFMAPLQAAYLTVVYPLQTFMNAFTNLQIWLVGSPVMGKRLASAKRNGKAGSDRERNQPRRTR